MKTNLKLLLVIITMLSNVFAGQGKEGGDALEIRFHEIRLDILSWVQGGGSSFLDFSSSETTNEVYLDEMLPRLKEGSVVVAFTDDQSEVMSYGVPKTCVNYIDDYQVENILCHRERFDGISDSEKYQLVHHEFAALAGIEVSYKGNSNYVLSSQLSDFLEEVRVLKLVVKPNNSSSIQNGLILALEKARIDCLDYFSRNLSWDLSDSTEVRKAISSNIATFDVNENSNLIKVSAPFERRTRKQAYINLEVQLNKEKTQATGLSLELYGYYTETVNRGTILNPDISQITKRHSFGVQNCILD